MVNSDLPLIKLRDLRRAPLALKFPRSKQVLGLEETSLLAHVHPTPWRSSLLLPQCRGHAWDFGLDHCCPRAPSPSLAQRSGAGSTLSLDGRSAHVVLAP